MNWKIRGTASSGDITNITQEITNLTTYVDNTFATQSNVATNYALKTDLTNKLIKVNGAQGLGAGSYKLGSGSTDKFSEVWATDFKGEAASANYADLAEKYTVDSNVELPVGTVMEISDGEYDAELCNTECSDCVIGIVSNKPGFIMNDNLDNSAIIGLTGTLPVRVVGPVRKKDILVSAGYGCLRKIESENEISCKVAVSFENNDQPGEKLVNCLVK